MSRRPNILALASKISLESLTYTDSAADNSDSIDKAWNLPRSSAASWSGPA